MIVLNKRKKQIIAAIEGTGTCENPNDKRKKAKKK